MLSSFLFWAAELEVAEGAPLSHSSLLACCTSSSPHIGLVLGTLLVRCQYSLSILFIRLHQINHMSCPSPSVSSSFIHPTTAFSCCLSSCSRSTVTYPLRGQEKNRAPDAARGEEFIQNSETHHTHLDSCAKQSRHQERCFSQVYLCCK